MAKAQSQKKSNANDSGLNFEQQLWAAAEQAVPVPHYRTTKYNPPFNMADWGGESLRQDVRCFSLPASNGERAEVSCRIQPAPVNKANYAWIQHFIHHLSPVGLTGCVMASGSMFSNQSGFREVHQKWGAKYDPAN